MLGNPRSQFPYAFAPHIQDLPTNQEGTGRIEIQLQASRHLPRCPRIIKIHAGALTSESHSTIHGARIEKRHSQMLGQKFCH